MFLTKLLSTVDVSVKARKVTVKGPRGKVTKDFSHLPCEIEGLAKSGNKKFTGPVLRIRMWFGGYKQACAVNTLKSHISNMIIGVTEVSQISRPHYAYNFFIGF